MRTIGGLLIDLDGTVYQGGALLAGAAATVATLRERRFPFLFTTNTSRKSRSDVAASLRGLGLEVDVDEIFTAPTAAARWLAAEGLRRVQLLVPKSTHADFEGFVITDERPEAVLVGDLGAAFTFDRLNAAFLSLRAGARLVAIHRNRFWIPERVPTLDAGPFVAALEYAASCSATLVGKPSPAFFDAAAALLDVPRRELAVVGDDLESDIIGGRAAGLVTLQVRTGKYDPDLVAGAPTEGRPHHSLAGIADVLPLLA